MPDDKALQSIIEYLSSHDDPELVSSTIASVVTKNTSISAMSLHTGIVTWREKYFAGANENLLEVLINMNMINSNHREVLYNVVLYILKRLEDKAFGRRAIFRTLITKDQFNEALAYQKKLFHGLKEIKRVERILRDEGLITAENAIEIWKDFNDFNQKRKKKGVLSEPASVKTAYAGLGKPLPPDFEDFLKKRNNKLSKVITKESVQEQEAGISPVSTQNNKVNDYQVPQTPADLKNQNGKGNSNLYDDDESELLDLP